LPDLPCEPNGKTFREIITTADRENFLTENEICAISDDMYTEKFCKSWEQIAQTLIEYDRKVLESQYNKILSDRLLTKMESIKDSLFT